MMTPYTLLSLAILCVTGMACVLWALVSPRRPASPALVPGSGVRRLGAACLDGLLVGSPAACLWLAVLGADGPQPGSWEPAAIIVTILTPPVGWLYWAGMESSGYQATFGKMAMGLKVTDAAGDAISIGRASLRYIAKFLGLGVVVVGFFLLLVVFFFTGPLWNEQSTRLLNYILLFVGPLLCLLGFLTIPFNQLKRGLHDVVAGTLVPLADSGGEGGHPDEALESDWRTLMASRWPSDDEDDLADLAPDSEAPATAAADGATSRDGQTSPDAPGVPRDALRWVILVAGLLGPAILIFLLARDSHLAAVMAIEKLGGEVRRDAKLPGKPVTGVLLYRTKATDAVLKGLKNFKQLTWLDLRGTKVTGAGLMELKDLKQLTTLYLDGTQVTDVGLKALVEIGLLHALSQAQGEGGKRPKDDSEVRSLDLRGTKVTGAGLMELKDLKQLTTLYLDGTQVTDVGLKELKEIGLLHPLPLARGDDDTKKAQKDLMDVVADLEAGKDVAAKVKAIKKTYEDLNITMHVYKSRERGGFGIGPAGKGDGIELRILHLGRGKLSPTTALNAANLAKEKADLIKMGYINLAVAKVAHAYAPARPRGGKGAKEWKAFADDKEKAARGLIDAARKGDAADLKKAAINLNNACYNCHSGFRDSN